MGKISIVTLFRRLDEAPSWSLVDPQPILKKQIAFFEIYVTDVTLHVMITTYTNNKVNKSLLNLALLAQLLIKLQKAHKEIRREKIEKHSWFKRLS